jgi:SAM-dependent methyltransferase
MDQPTTMRPLRMVSLFLLLLSFSGIVLSQAEEGNPKKKGPFIADGTEEYSKEFFQQHLMNFPIYEELVKEMYKLLPRGKKTSSVLDVGCGGGYLVEAWRLETPLKSYCVEGSVNATLAWSPIVAPHYYKLVDLKSPDAFDHIPKTDVVTSFEVAEHLPPSHADHFVQLIVHHSPEIVFFGAATPNQDNGRNPSHLNENTFTYWMEKFRAQGYVLDFPRTARYRHSLILNPTYAQYFGRSWWYLKNALIFLPQHAQKAMDQELVAHPKEADIFNPAYLGLGGESLKPLWERDWTEFATLFYEEQKKARRRLMYDDYDD